MGGNDQWKSLVAGATAGAVEGVITYPFEFAKTRLQLVSKSGAKQARNPISLILNVAKTDGFSALYAGCVPAVIGNTAKAGVRFMAFDSIKDILRAPDGSLSKTRGAIAGLGAGILESVVALTPSESIKTAFIDDRQRAQPRYNKGFVRGVAQLVKDHGPGALYRGVLPVTLRQASNSFVRLGSYNAIKTLIQDHQRDPTAPLGSGLTFVVGALAGTITVYATMPIDTVKTRMQSVEAKKTYTGLLDCFAQIVRKEGVKTLWRGSTARLGRLILSGGIVFTIYEKIMLIL